MNDKNNDSCVTCYAIVCKRCKWQANEDAVAKIQAGELTKCPVCGWKPGEVV